MLGVTFIQALLCSHTSLYVEFYGLYRLYQREENVPGTVQGEGPGEKEMPTTGKTGGRQFVPSRSKFLLNAPLLFQCFISSSFVKSILGDYRVPGWQLFSFLKLKMPSHGHFCFQLSLLKSWHSVCQFLKCNLFSHTSTPLADYNIFFSLSLIFSFR